MAPATIHPLHTFMAQVTREMASEYERIYARAAEDPGTAGDEGEENWAALLREWLPPNYHVRTKGRIIAHDGSCSSQIDVVVLKPSYPLKLLEKRIWLSNGVAAAFECKNTLTAAHVMNSIERCSNLKKLYKVRTGSPQLELRCPLFYGILAHSHSWTKPCSRPEENIKRAIELAPVPAEHPRLELDTICVADLATWTSGYMPYYPASWAPEHEAVLRERFGAGWGATTSFSCASYDSPDQHGSFRPVAAMVAHLIHRLAWVDAGIRDFADYYRLVNMWGSSVGAMRFWPASIFSEEVRRGIEQGRTRNGVIWDEWSLAGF